MNTDILIDNVIEQIIVDVQSKDMTAIAELLQYVPIEKLEAFLPEVKKNDHFRQDV